MCAALKAARQGYYAWKRRPPSAHAMRDEELAELISWVRAEVRGIYGAPKAFFAPRRMGVRTSMKRVARIMRERGWRGAARACAKRPSGEKRAARRESAEDLVKRKFSADGPNMAWFADITYVKTRQGWLYLALVMDIWSRRIVGWAMGPSITAELADEALKMALARRNNPKGCVHHSDHGAQYVSLLLFRTMREHEIRPSMGSISSPWDNAAMESLMGIVNEEDPCMHTLQSTCFSCIAPRKAISHAAMRAIAPIRLRSSSPLPIRYVRTSDRSVHLQVFRGYGGYTPEC